jgi:ribulose-5-phosphate 4-epimerase/fuculose-1-phosphate aldolase
MAITTRESGFEAVADEAIVRRDLAACFRLFAHLGLDDLVLTHISARVPGAAHFFVNPQGMTFDEMTASSLLKVDYRGQLIGEAPYGVNPATGVIHGGILEARPDANCVIHLHTADGVAVSGIEDGLLPLNQQSLTVWHDIAYHDFEGVAVDDSERDSLRADLGARNLMILRNHGTLGVGASVAEAFHRSRTLEWACTIQVRTLAMGRALHPVAPEVIERFAAFGGDGMSRFANDIVWPAMLRLLDRVNPGYDA